MRPQYNVIFFSSYIILFVDVGYLDLWSYLGAQSRLSFAIKPIFCKLIRSNQPKTSSNQQTICSNRVQYIGQVITITVSVQRNEIVLKIKWSPCWWIQFRRNLNLRNNLFTTKFTNLALQPIVMSKSHEHVIKKKKSVEHFSHSLKNGVASGFLQQISGRNRVAWWLMVKPNVSFYL